MARQRRDLCRRGLLQSSEEAHDDCAEHLQNLDIKIEPPKTPRNRFAILLDELTDANARTCLRAICDGHHRTSDIEKQVGISIAPYLHHLNGLGLIHDDLVGGIEGCEDFRKFLCSPGYAGAANTKQTTPVKPSRPQRSFWQALSRGRRNKRPQVRAGSNLSAMKGGPAWTYHGRYL